MLARLSRRDRLVVGHGHADVFSGGLGDLLERDLPAVELRKLRFMVSLPTRDARVEQHHYGEHQECCRYHCNNRSHYWHFKPTG